MNKYNKMIKTEESLAIVDEVRHGVFVDIIHRIIVVVKVHLIGIAWFKIIGCQIAYLNGVALRRFYRIIRPSSALV